MYLNYKFPSKYWLRNHCPIKKILILKWVLAHKKLQKLCIESIKPFFLFPIGTFCMTVVNEQEINIGTICWGSSGCSVVSNPATMQEMWVWSLGWEDPLEKEIATSGILAREIPWTPLPEEPGRATVHQFSSVQSVTRSGRTLCDPMDCSTPGFPVHL